jgi:hypothetical protein
MAKNLSTYRANSRKGTEQPEILFLEPR